MSISQMLSSKKFALFIFLLFAAVHLLISIFTIIPGYVLNDEAIYHLMIRNFAKTGGFEIWNGYQEFPSPELVPIFTSAHKGRLVAQYPYLYPLLCIPFYQIGGYYGLFFVNVLAFPGIVALCYAIAQKLFFDRRLAFTACCIFVLATFSYEYSQATLTHVVMTFFLTAAFYLYLYSLNSFSHKIPPWPPSNSLRTGSLMEKPTPDHSQEGNDTPLPPSRGRPTPDPSRADSGLTGNDTPLPPSRGELFFSLLPALVSGFIIGFTMGIRLDAVFLLPCVILPFLFMRPWRPWAALATCVGALPGIALLSATNYIKFGTLFFLSYGYQGTMFWRHLPFAGLGAGALVVLWILSRRSMTARLCRYTRQAIVLLLICVAVLIMIPQTRIPVGKRVNAIGQLLIDFRVRTTPNSEELSQFSPQRGMHIPSMDGLKKSLLQSCPYLVVLLLPLLKIFRGNRDFFPLLLLFLVPIVFTGFYAYYAWHGGHSLNLRYLIPIFPFTSILSAYAWHELTNGLPRRWGWIAAIICILVVSVYFFILRPVFKTFDQQEFPYLTLPLILALCLLTLLVIREIVSKTTTISNLAVGIMLITMFWAGLVEFFYDYPRARRVRRRSLEIATQTVELVSDNAILFTTEPFPFFRLIERDRMRIANPAEDKFQSFPELLVFHINSGHSVYAAFEPEQWGVLRKQGVLDPARYKVIPMGYSSGILGKIVLRTTTN